MTEVVAALIWDQNKFLACQRPAHKARGLLWEFVGGKVEPGETAEAALIRECREELAVTVEVGPVFMEVTHTYPDLTVHLVLYNAAIADGTPQLLEHNAFAWITTEEIDSYDFCPADVDILRKLKGVKSALEACLISLADPTYKEFQCGLMPTVAPHKVLGVRMPQLRAFAKQLYRFCDIPQFLNALPHRYYEEDNLHALLICEMKDYSETVSALDRFLPFVDNWATCDMLSPKAFRRHPDGLIPQVNRWLESPYEYVRRFGISVLMKYYLDDFFAPEHLIRAAAVPRKEYYVKMMVAWYFATALAKQYDAAVTILIDRVLDPWTHNKAIQKAIESYRISDSKKAYLRSLKIKQKEGNYYA